MTNRVPAAPFESFDKHSRQLDQSMPLSLTQAQQADQGFGALAQEARDEQASASHRNQEFRQELQLATNLEQALARQTASEQRAAGEAATGMTALHTEAAQAVAREEELKQEVNSYELLMENMSAELRVYKEWCENDPYSSNRVNRRVALK